MGHSFKIEQSLSEKWIEKINTIHNDDCLYLIDWFTVNDVCYGVGIYPKTNNLCKFKANLTPCLFVWCRDETILHSIIVHATQLVDFKRGIKKCNIDKFKSNYASYIDELLDNGNADANWQLFEVPTFSFHGSKKLHTMLNSNTSVLSYISTTASWSVEIFLMIHNYLKNKDGDHSIYSTMLNRNLDTDASNFKPELDIMVFDIETVSHEDHRLPMGNQMTDIIFSITIIKYSKNKNLCELETIFNIPLNVEDELTKSFDIINNHKKPYTYVKSRNTKIVNSEEELLQETFRHFQDDRFKPYILLGYNSRFYDLTFLLRRSVMLNMPEIEHFYYRYGILTFGHNMFHIDMQQIILKYYRGELSSFSLKNVAKELLEHVAKVDFDARLLRYIYKTILDDESIHDGKFTSDQCSGYSGDKWSVDLETLSYYNDMDSIVVLSLWLQLQYEEFLLFVTKSNFISLLRVAQTGVSEYLNNNIIYEGLTRSMVCTNHFHDSYTYNDKLNIKTNFNILASSNNKESAGYGGGFNFRDSKEYIPSIIAMDAQAYYPELIAGFNLSHETTTLFTVQGLLEIIKEYPDKKIDCDIYRFCTHKNIIPETTIDNLDLLDNMSSKQYIFNIQDNGTLISIDYLNKLQPTERLLLISKRPGLLSNIIKHRNHIRNIAKSSKKSLNSSIEKAEELTGIFEISNNTEEVMEDDEDDFEDYEAANDAIPDAEEVMEDEDDFEDYEAEETTKELIDFDINTYKIARLNKTEEEYMVISHYKVISKAEFMKYKNPLEALNTYIFHLKRDFIRVNSQYRNMKIINNSIYGLLGAQFGALKCKNIAAASTMLGRKYIIEAAKIGREINCRCVYSDTDSVFFDVSKSTVKDPSKYIITKVKNINQHLILNAKTYQDIFIIAKKKYIANSDAVFSRGINKNGPLLWNENIYKFYTKYICQKTPVYMKDVFDIMYDLYTCTYKQIKNNRKLILCNMHIMDEDNYKTNTPAKKLITRIKKEIPYYVFGSKLTYFNILKDVPTTTHFGLDIELETIPLKYINLYQFYSKIIKTLFDIISYSITRTNEERNLLIKYPMNIFVYENLNAFIKANSEQN